MNNNDVVEKIVTYIINEERDKQARRFSPSPKSDAEVVKNVLDVLERLMQNEN